MSTNINADLLRQFFVDVVGSDKLRRDVARELDIEDDEFDTADVDENNVVDIEEALEDSKLYEKFATMYVAEEEKKAEAKDEEKEKEEQSKVEEGNGSASA